MEGYSILPQGFPPVNGEISSVLTVTLNLVLSLCRKRGYCWAHNDWLAERLGISERQVSRRITALVHAGLLTSYRVGNERHIRPVRVQAKTPRCLPANLKDSTHTREQQTAAPKPVSKPDAVPAPIIVPSATPFLHELDLIGVKMYPALLQALRTTPQEQIRTVLSYCRRKGYGPGGYAAALVRGWNVGNVGKSEQERSKPRIRTEPLLPPMMGDRPDMGFLRGCLRGGS